MKIVAVTITRNSAWCLPASARAALRWCDEIVIHDHASKDATPAIIDGLEYEYPGRVHRLHCSDPLWREMHHRQRTLNKAREVGASHVAIVDDDEIMTENIVGSIRGEIERLAPGEVLQIPWIHCWRSLKKWRDDESQQAGAYVSLAFPDKSELCWITASGYDYHHRHPYHSSGSKRVGNRSAGGLFHLQHVNWRRLVAKQTWYMLTEMVRWGRVRANYAGTIKEDGLKLSDVPAEWVPPEFDLLRPDDEPWQAADIRRMVAENGVEKFPGIDLTDFI